MASPTPDSTRAACRTAGNTCMARYRERAKGKEWPVPDSVTSGGVSDPPTTTKKVRAGAVQVSAYVEADVVYRAKNAIVALRDHPKGPRNLSAFANEAFRRELLRLEKAYNDGQPFAQRPEDELPAGRPRRGYGTS